MKYIVDAMKNRTIFIFATEEDDRELEVDRLLPVLPDGSAIELEDAAYFVESTSMTVNIETGYVTLFITLK